MINLVHLLTSHANGMNLFSGTGNFARRERWKKLTNVPFNFLILDYEYGNCLWRTSSDGFFNLKKTAKFKIMKSIVQGKFFSLTGSVFFGVFDVCVKTPRDSRLSKKSSCGAYQLCADFSKINKNEQNTWINIECEGTAELKIVQNCCGYLKSEKVLLSNIFLNKNCISPVLSSSKIKACIHISVLKCHFC